MRDIPLLIGLVAMLPMILIRPHVGVLAWCWTALLVPNYYVFGLATGIRFNLWIACATLISWLLSREAKRIPMNGTSVLLMLFLAWGTISSLFSIGPQDFVVWDEWDKF